MKISVATFFNWFRLLPLFALLTLLTACGKIGEPLPPIPRTPLIVDELKVVQEGTRMVLRFPLVRSRQTREIDRIDVYRLVESGTDPAGLPVEVFASRASVIASIPADQIPLNRSAATFVDPLEPLEPLKLGSIVRGVRYRYAIRIVNRNGAAADLSNYAMILPLTDVAAPPAGVAAAQTEREIVITWQPPPRNANGTTPVNLAGYNIYRKTVGSEAPPTRLNRAPIAEPRFSDQLFQFGLSYEYQVRAISQPPNQANQANQPGSGNIGIVESDESPTLIHQAKDSFAPAAPGSLTIASVNRIVSLFWPLNTEADIAGYHIYRADEENAPPAGWRRLDPQLHQTGSWRDDRVTAGKTYFYRITAVDRFGNESLPSAIVSETVLP